MEEYGAVLQNQPVDVSGEFTRQDNHFFIDSKVSEFDPRSASGRILWKGLALKQRVSYHQLTLQFKDYRVWEDLPAGEYEDDQNFPFFMSSRGYGMFVHTSAPLTLDLGGSYDEAAVIYLGDDVLDLFVFFGSPKEVLSEYTALTGRAPAPPLWTFGLWMGRESVLFRRRGPGRREDAPSVQNPLRRHPPRHRLDRGAPPLRLQVLRVALPGPGAHDLRPQRRRLPYEPVAAPLLRP
jgi:hypothetical protein